LAASVPHDRAIEEIEAGHDGRDVNKWLEPFREAGCTQLLTLVGAGALTTMHPASAYEGTLRRKGEAIDLDFVFQPDIA